MTLTPGTRLGPYEIVAAIGAGGMGEVYRATDTHLKRAVAIKVLPASVAADADRLARFQREAEVLATLNHPNIAAVYGLEKTLDVTALVMELVEGEDLSAHIARGPIALPEALPIARQIIDALEAAHEQGIIHRDLKPANVKVREDGTVKVLDFGLAKALAPEGASAAADAMNSPTLTARATQMGMILGTAAYMSPEQARGKAVDKRTDVWAFGCVLYEMLTGRQAFEGDDATEIISAVVKTEPDWSAWPASVPAHVRTIVTRCLVKDRKARIPDLSVVRFMLDGSLTAAAPSGLPSTPAGTTAGIWKVATALFVLTTLAGGAAWYRGRTGAPAVMRFVISAPDNTTFAATTRPDLAAISPDGRLVALTATDATGKRLLWVRRIDAVAALPLSGTEGAAYPFWSPDSRVIGFSVSGKLMKIAAAGGPAQNLTTLQTPTTVSRGAAWSRDGIIVFNNGPAPLNRVSQAGGEATPIGTLADGENGRDFPSFLPDGRHVLYHTNFSKPELAGVYVTSLDTGESKRIVGADTGGVYAAQGGYLLFGRQGTLMAQTFDPKTLSLEGEAAPLGERLESGSPPGLVAFSVSDTGALTYVLGDAVSTDFEMMWVDRKGKVTGKAGPPAQYRGLDLSPDGTRIAAHRDEGTGGDIWLTDIARGVTSRFTTLDGAQENASPVWSPDSRRIAFASLRAGKWGVYVKPSDGAGSEEKLVEFPATELMGPAPFSWAPDGRLILFGMADPTTRRDLWGLSLSGDRKTVPLVHSSFTEGFGQISPDGRWLAFSSNDTGRSEIYVQPLPSGARTLVSSDGGALPRWRRDSRELFYRGVIGGGAQGKMMAVDVNANGSAFMAGQPVPLFEFGRILTGGQHSTDFFPYAVSKDGHFLISRVAEAAGADAKQPAVMVVLNWTEALKK